MNQREHLLTIAGEECAEIQQIISKINRFGLHETNVEEPEGPDNSARLASELNDLMGVIELLIQDGVLKRNWENQTAQRRKRLKVLKFMEYSKDCLTLMERTGSEVKLSALYDPSNQTAA